MNIQHSKEEQAVSCAKCRFFKRTVFGMMVQSGGWDGVEINDQHFKAIGVGFCEHPGHPRGLVLAIYSCGFWRDKTPDREMIGDK